MVLSLPRRWLWVLSALILTLAVLWGGHRANTPTVAPPKTVPLYVIMYHGLHPDSKKQGDYVISPALFEDDLRYLTERGYTTVNIEQLLQFAAGGELPPKPVLLTFDDGYLNNHLYATPVLKAYRCQAVLFPIVSETVRYSALNDHNAAYAQVTWDNLREMCDTGCWDIQNHSFALHTYTNRNGSSRLPFESLAEYAQVLTKDIGQAQTLLKTELGITPCAFAYPFGAIGDGELNILREMGFAVTFTCTEQSNVLSPSAESLLDLGRFRRRNHMSAETFFTHVVKLP